MEFKSKETIGKRKEIVAKTTDKKIKMSDEGGGEDTSTYGYPWNIPGQKNVTNNTLK